MGWSVRGWVVRSTIVVAVLMGVLYGAAAYVVYDEVSKTADPGAARYAGISPANLRFVEDGSSQDFSRFEMTDFREVRFASRDTGIEVAAWFVPAGYGAPAVIVSHGLRASRHDPAALVPAGMLNAHGFAVLVIDMRDHGDSTREDGRYAGGAEEQSDVLGARDWLVGQGFPTHRIGLFGTSMGAGATLIAAALEPGTRAVWEDSSYADTQTRIAEELKSRGYPEILAPAAPLMARLISGDDIASWSPLTAARALDGAALFVAHGADDRVTLVHHADDLYQGALSAGVHAELWIAPGMGHTEAYRRMADEYEARLVRFFETHLGAPKRAE